jgi:hypothetical protein
VPHVYAYTCNVEHFSTSICDPTIPQIYQATKTT